MMKKSKEPFKFYSYEGPHGKSCHQASVCRFGEDIDDNHECYLMVYGNTEKEAIKRAKWIAEVLNKADKKKRK